MPSSPEAARLGIPEGTPSSTSSAPTTPPRARSTSPVHHPRRHGRLRLPLPRPRLAALQRRASARYSQPFKAARPSVSSLAWVPSGPNTGIHLGKEMTARDPQHSQRQGFPRRRMLRPSDRDIACLGTCTGHGNRASSQLKARARRSAAACWSAMAAASCRKGRRAGKQVAEGAPQAEVTGATPAVPSASMSWRSCGCRGSRPCRPPSATAFRQARPIPSSGEGTPAPGVGHRGLPAHGERALFPRGCPAAPQPPGRRTISGLVTATKSPRPPQYRVTAGATHGLGSGRTLAGNSRSAAATAWAAGPSGPGGRCPRSPPPSHPADPARRAHEEYGRAQAFPGRWLRPRQAAGFFHLWPPVLLAARGSRVLRLGPRRRRAVFRGLGLLDLSVIRRHRAARRAPGQWRAHR